MRFARKSGKRHCPTCGADGNWERCPADGTDGVLMTGFSRSALSFKPGEIVANRYRIEAPIARGAFGAVYRAVHTGTRQHVAIKLLSVDPAAVKDDVIRRFYREAQNTAALASPHTVRVQDIGQVTDGPLFLIMELLEGATVLEIMEHLGDKGCTMPQRHAAEICIQALESLGEAHGKDLVHRDLKLANLVVAHHGDSDVVVKVIDFGIARTAESSLTADGVTLGTPQFMSPEHFKGEVIDGRADLYAMGVLLYSCLTGRPPFDGQTPFELMRQHIQEPPPDPRQFASAPIAESLLRVLWRALAKDPAKRYQDAAEMSAALKGCLAELPTAPPLSVYRSLDEQIQDAPLVTEVDLSALALDDDDDDFDDMPPTLNLDVLDLESLRSKDQPPAATRVLRTGERLQVAPLMAQAPELSLPEKAAGGGLRDLMAGDVDQYDQEDDLHSWATVAVDVLEMESGADVSQPDQDMAPEPTVVRSVPDAAVKDSQKMALAAAALAIAVVGAAGIWLVFGSTPVANDRNDAAEPEVMAGPSDKSTPKTAATVASAGRQTGSTEDQVNGHPAEAGKSAVTKSDRKEAEELAIRGIEADDPARKVRLLRQASLLDPDNTLYGSLLAAARADLARHRGQQAPEATTDGAMPDVNEPMPREPAPQPARPPKTDAPAPKIGQAEKAGRAAAEDRAANMIALALSTSNLKLKVLYARKALTDVPDNSFYQRVLKVAEEELAEQR